MQIIRSILFLALAFLSVHAFSQSEKQIARYEQMWVGYLNQTRLSERWGIWYDMHLRTQQQWSHGLMFGMGRIGATYYAGDAAKITAGYAFLNFYPEGGGITQPEHRLWQQLQITGKAGKLRILHQFRTEQRFKQKIQDGHRTGDFLYSNRIRYNAILSYPLSESGKWTAVAGNEILLNAGRNVVYNPFDQDRIFLGMGYKITPNTNLQAGYNYIFQQSGQGYQYKQSNVLRVFLFHNLDFAAH